MPGATPMPGSTLGGHEYTATCSEPSAPTRTRAPKGLSVVPRIGQSGSLTTRGVRAGPMPSCHVCDATEPGWNDIECTTPAARSGMSVASSVQHRPPRVRRERVHQRTVGRSPRSLEQAVGHAVPDLVVVEAGQLG